MEDKIYKWIMIIAFSAVVIYAIYDNISEHYAMKDSTIVKAKIIDLWS